jgi:hypothetical protein
MFDCLPGAAVLTQQFQQLLLELEVVYLGGECVVDEGLCVFVLQWVDHVVEKVQLHEVEQLLVLLSALFGHFEVGLIVGSLDLDNVV